VAGWRGGGDVEETAATVVTECSRRSPKLSTTITAPAKAGAIPAGTMTAEAAAEAAAEAVAEAVVEAVVVARRIATPPPPTGGGLQSYRIEPTLAVECSLSYTAAASAAAAAAVPHILPMIGRMTMRAAGGAAPATTRGKGTASVT